MGEWVTLQGGETLPSPLRLSQALSRQYNPPTEAVASPACGTGCCGKKSL